MITPYTFRVQVHFAPPDRIALGLFIDLFMLKTVSYAARDAAELRCHKKSETELVFRCWSDPLLQLHALLS